MRKWLAIPAVAVTIGAAWAGDGGQGTDRPTDVGDGGLVEEKGRRAWHFRVGPVMAPRIRTSLRAPRVVLPSVPRSGASSGVYGTAVPGPQAGYVRRDYVDGRVYPDAGTEDPDTMVYGLTWDWGADNVSAQYSNGRMTFHSDAGRWTETSSSFSFAEGAGCDDSTDFRVGVEAMGGWTFWDNRTFDAAVDAGFRYYGSGDLSAQSRGGASVTTTRSEFRFVDTYDASGWTSVPSGSYEGTAGGPGRLLGALPDRREEQTGSYESSRSYSSCSRADLDYDIWDLRLGPTFGWKPTDWFALRGGVYGLLGLVGASLKTDVVSSAGTAAESTSTCGALFGMAFGVSAQVNVTDWLFLMGGVEYDWWTDSVCLNAGGAEAEIKPSDISVSICLGVEF